MTHQSLSFNVEAFAALHPEMDPGMAMFARAALVHHGGSPRTFEALRDGAAHPATVSFALPDRRTGHSYERATIVEHGAIVLAGLLLAEWAGKQITRVVARGTRVDYFVGEAPQDQRWILEVGGTDAGSHQATRTDKKKQLGQSFYRRAPCRKDGFVAATRFAEPAVTSLDAVAAEAP